MTEPLLDRTVDRRRFFRMALGAGAYGVALPSLLAACGRDEPAVTAPGGGGQDALPGEQVLVGDVVDYALTSEDWAGAFGFVTFRLQRGAVDGTDVYLVRTDTSEEEFAATEKLVWAPKLGGLAAGRLTGDAFLVSGGTADQAIVLSSEPGRPEYTPAWRVHRATWSGTARPLRSIEDVEAAAQAGDLDVEETDIVLNGAVVKWSDGEMPVDEERTEYLGGGQLLEPIDTEALTAKFKLHECFPGVRYVVFDVSLEPMAEGMNVAHSPGLAGSPTAGATGRTNVFMNGLKGPGPMGFQPSVFDSRAGTPEWSPYWDHMTYAWKDGVEPRVLANEDGVHAARDAGELDEFPGTPDTEGAVFTVNCPVPILAPNTFEG
ncbi:MAG: hypothetical protein LC799_03315 [Actinobacteria bacterium]|nr:hypothetical protein [Actinomycetota bacterium]